MQRERKKSAMRAGTVFLRLSLLLILGVTVALVVNYLNARAEDPLMAFYKYAPMVEYIFASSLIAVGGALLIELVEKKGRE